MKIGNCGQNKQAVGNAVSLMLAVATSLPSGLIAIPSEERSPREIWRSHNNTNN